MDTKTMLGDGTGPHDGNPLAARTLIHRFHEAWRSGGWTAAEAVLEATLRRYWPALRAEAGRMNPDDRSGERDIENVFERLRRNVLRAAKSWAIPGEGDALDWLRGVLRRVLDGPAPDGAARAGVDPARPGEPPRRGPVAMHPKRKSLHPLGPSLL